MLNIKQENCELFKVFWSDSMRESNPGTRVENHSLDSVWV